MHHLQNLAVHKQWDVVIIFLDETISKKIVILLG